MTCNVSPGATTAPSRGESILRCGSLLPALSRWSLRVDRLEPGVQCGACRQRLRHWAVARMRAAYRGRDPNHGPAVNRRMEEPAAHAEQKKQMGCFIPRGHIALQSHINSRSPRARHSCPGASAAPTLRRVRCAVAPVRHRFRRSISCGLVLVNKASPPRSESDFTGSWKP